MGFDGKVVVVTGAGGGIGAGVVEAFSRNGAVVWVTDIDFAKAEQMANGMQNTAYAAVLDVSNTTQAKSLMERIEKTSGKIDILINVAAIDNRQMVEDLAVEQWRQLLDINLTGVFICSQAVIPYMKKRHYGKIVNVASIAAKRISFTGSAAYTAAKAGVIGFTRHLAYELAYYGINVNAICPGPTLTPLLRQTLPPEDEKIHVARIPAGRLLNPDDQANAVLFLCSDEASMICGVALDVDGGSLLGWINREEYETIRSAYREH